MSEHIPTEDLSARIDDALSPARRDQVDAHLAGCEACREEMASLRWAADFARALPPAPMPEGLRLELPSSEHRTAGEPDGVFSFGRWAGLAALAALLILSFGLGRMMDGGQGADPAGEADGAEMAMVESSADEAMAPADSAELDIDSAVRRAQERAEPQRDPEPLLQPLATALTDERAEMGSRGAAAVRVAPPAEAATATSAAADAGGYRPPDLQVPGAPAARDLPAPMAGTASAITAARATASAALALLATLEIPPESGGGSPEAEATRQAARDLQPEVTVEAAGTAMAALGSSAAAADRQLEAGRVATLAAANAIAAERATVTAEARVASEAEEIAAPDDAVDRDDAGAERDEDDAAGAAEPSMEDESSAEPVEAGRAEPEGEDVTASEPLADASMDETAGLDEAGPDDAPGASSDVERAGPSTADSTNPALAPRSLWVPMLALSVGLLALGTLLLRQARRGRRRRRHLER